MAVHGRLRSSSSRRSFVLLELGLLLFFRAWPWSPSPARRSRRPHWARRQPGSAKATAPFGKMPTSPSSPGTPSSSGSATANATAPFGEMPAPAEPKEEEEAAALDHGRRSTSSPSSSSSPSSAGSLFHLDAADLGSASVPAMPEDAQDAAPVQSAPVDWPTWSEETPRTVDDSFSSDSGGTALPGPTSEAPLVQTVPEIDAAAVAALTGGGGGFDPDRIPASVFQPRTSVSQAEWSVASNESLFSIHGARQSADLGGLHADSSRSHFDYFYDEAMAVAAGAEHDSKLPPVAEEMEPGDGKEFTVPGSTGSEASNNGSAGAKRTAAVFRRHESGSGGSSSNFSFSFPILAETSPKKKDGLNTALYQPLQKEYEPPMPRSLAQPPTSSAFVDDDGWCCCGCCWFDCSAWSACCCRWRGDCCRCSCPSLCRCNWCLCF